MAKKEKMSPIEQHFEKGVLGLAILAVIVSLGYWGFSSPRRIAFGPRELKLEEADEELLHRADARKRQIDELPPATYDKLTYAEAVASRIDDPLDEQAIEPAPGSLADPQQSLGAEKVLWALQPPPLLQPDQQDQTQLGVVLSEIQPPAPGKPAVEVNRELLRAAEPVEVIVAHVVSSWDLGEWRGRLEKELRRAQVPPRAVVLTVVARRQERLPNGQWGNEQPVAMVAFDRRTNEQLVGARYPNNEPLVPPYELANVNEVRQAMSRLDSPDLMKPVIQPDFLDIYWHSLQWGSWLIHFPDNPVSQAARERGMQQTVEGTNVQLRMPTPTPGATPGPTYREEEVPREYYEGDPADYYRRGATGRTVPPRTGAAGTTRTPTAARTTAPPPAARTTAAPPLSATAVEVPPIPPLREQITEGKVQVWFHDISLSPERQYRYRLQLVVLNPLLSYDAPSQARIRAEARKRFILTEFSPWSDPVSVPEVKHVFLVGGARDLNQARVTVFMQRLGQILEARFTVTRGSGIGTPATVQAIDHATGSLVQREFDFHTGGVVLALDFDKKVFRTGIPRQTVEMLYVDRHGELRRAINVNDMDPRSKEAELYRELREKASRRRQVAPPAGR